MSLKLDRGICRLDMTAVNRLFGTSSSLPEALTHMVPMAEPAPHTEHDITTSSTDAPNSTPLAARIGASAENWRRKLLDLTRRNRLLNFRTTKVSTVTVVDEQPAQVFRQLYLAGRPMKFKAARAPEEPAAQTPVLQNPEGQLPSPGAESRDTFSEDEEDDADTALNLDFVPYDQASLEERHTDEWLQTTAVPDALDKSLRRIEEQARSTIEEQGVNTLFLAIGMLSYRESPQFDEWWRAPLVLLPVELSRKSARSGYTLSATDDEPIVNPALSEYLRRDFGIALPQLPDSNAISDDYDLQSFLAAARECVSAQKDWSIKTDVYLGLFSFQKFVMYKDLEANNSALESHRLIQQLVGRTGNLFGTLPSDVRDMDLDEKYPPESTFQVVDADSSQLRAIASAARNYDLVLEGPPGTGKSQTITNLIAQALSAGKSVLFVAEKMAALDVVHRRLVGAGLGEFCLEMHSTKANKRSVMQSLAIALDASLQPVTAPTASTQRIPAARHTLTEYIDAVHQPALALGQSPYSIYGALGAVNDAPKVRWTGSPDSITREELAQVERDLRDLAVVSISVGSPSAHPYSGARKTFYSEADLDAIRALADEVIADLGILATRIDAVEAAFEAPSLSILAEIDATAAIGDLVRRSPGAPIEVLNSSAWNAPPLQATALVEQGRALNALSALVLSRFNKEVTGQDHSGDIAYVQNKASGLFGFLAVLDSRYRTIKRRWLAYRAAFTGTLLEQADEMKRVDQLRADRESLTLAAGEAQQLFGTHWEGESSNWNALQDYIQWVVEFRATCVRQHLSERTVAVASTASPDVTSIDALLQSARSLRARLGELGTRVGWPEHLLTDLTLKDMRDKVSALSAGVPLGPRWAAFESVRQKVAAGPASELLEPATSGQISFEQMASAFLRAFYQSWLGTVVRDRAPLREFHTLTHEQRIIEFRDLDERVLRENRTALVGQLRNQVQARLRTPEAERGMSILRGQMARQRNLAPLRVTMTNAEAAVRAIKPCIMMSPLTVAQLIGGSQPSFDLVVFDEASQLPAEDAVGAIMRGKQLVVVGDPKQLPPTNFFSVTHDTDVAPVGEDGLPIYADSESVLEEYLGAGLPTSRLKWHYRSAHESLITFSNVSFYDAELYTFPSVETGTEAGGLQFEYVADGVYEGKGLNIVEARRVADSVVRFAKEQLQRQVYGEQMLSLGVGTFNLRQQLAIQDELEQRRRDEPEIEPFFARGGTEPFFVKNLENIQGDERDVIFISVTYAKSNDGRLRYNFGPLNGQNGWRRLNVLITRARSIMRVFSSMKGDEISPAASSSIGPRLLREFLIYAESGRLESIVASATAAAESPFEQEVIRELTLHGVNVVPQVGFAGYRIDIGVVDDVSPGKFLCGIECDGVSYHSAQTARDRDRLRQQVLESRGWTIHRVWSTDWFKDRQGQIDRLISLIESDRRRASDKAETEKAARDRAAVETTRLAAEEVAAAAMRQSSSAAGLGASASAAAPYTRPAAAPYRITSGEASKAGADLLSASESEVAGAVTLVVSTEAPIHTTDLLARVAGIWGNRAGSRIASRISGTCRSLERDGTILKRGDFYWSPSESCTVRTRAGMKIPGDRIAPEEYQAAIATVLAGGHGFTRPQLVAEVRSVLGFSRTGPTLEEAIQSAISAMLARGQLGEGSTGIRIRAGSTTESSKL